MNIQPMLQPRKTYSQTALTAIIGVGFGLMPVAGDFFAVLMAVLSLGFLAVYGSAARMTLGVGFVAQYILIQSSLIIYHEGLHSFTSNHLTYILLLFFLVPIVNMIQGMYSNFDHFEKYIEFGLMLSFGLILLDFYTNYFGLDSLCRVSVFSGNPLLPAPAILMIFFPLLFASVGRNHGMSKLQGILLATVIIAIGAFMGARMAFYTTLFLLFVSICIFIAKFQFRTAAKAFIYSVLGIVAIFAIDIQSNCGFTVRITEQVENFSKVANMALETPDQQPIESPKDSAAQVPAPQNLASPENTPVSPTSDPIAEDPSDVEIMSAGGSRAELWQVAYPAIKEKPLLGYGFAAEAKLIAAQLAHTGHLHLHNQYLSWLIWGGVICLLSGLALLFSPFFVFQSKIVAFFFTLSWGLILMTDSLLISPTVLAWYVLGLLLYEKYLNLGDQRQG